MSFDKRSCMARAKALLSEPTAEHLRYAALELRFCIEALTYEKLRSFASDIPEEVLNIWQPPQAVKALLEFEPDADQTFTIYTGVEETYGVPSPNMKLVGTHHSLKLPWLRKHYNKLGSCLHSAPTTRHEVLTGEQLAKYLAEVIADLEAPLAGNILGGSIRDVFAFSCSRCQDRVVVNAKSVRRTQQAACFNPQCKAEYFAIVNEDGTATFQLKITSFECANIACNGVADIENRHLDIGYKFSCPQCGLKHVIANRQWGYGRSEG
ncbi:MAG TPA: hypothetical protein VFV71_06390 [Burkholderiales bacterium]|nr:hypothetical protein [Burkholderiales bacterium]